MSAVTDGPRPPAPVLRPRPPLPVVPGGTRSTAFLDLARTVALEVAEFLAGDGVVLHGRDVVLVGERSTALGLSIHERPRSLTLLADDGLGEEDLLSAARACGLADALPDPLRAVAWGDLEAGVADVLVLEGVHLRGDVGPVLDACLPALRPGGLVVWRADPLWTSADGAGLVRWGVPAFHHRLVARDALVGALAETLSGREPDEEARALAGALGDLPELGPDDLLAAVRERGLLLRKLAVRSEGVHVPDALQGAPAGELTTAGLLVLAQRADEPGAGPDASLG